MQGKRDPFKTERDGAHYLTGKLVGGFVSQQAHAYLRLLAVYKGGSMQSNIQQMLEEWMLDKEPETLIIKALVDRAYAEWRRREWPKIKWDEFEEEMRERLVKKKLDFETIEKIQSEMRAKVGKIK